MKKRQRVLQMVLVTCLVVFQSSQAASAEEGLAPPHVSQGNVYLESGTLLEAFIEFTKALDIQSDLHPAHEGIINVFQAFLQLPEPDALEQIREAQLAFPGRSDVLNLALGKFYLNRGSPEQALTLISKIQEAEHTSPPFPLGYFHVTKGETYRRMGDVSTAITHFEEALRINPESIDARASLGYAYQDRGDNTQAAIHFREALDVLNPELPQAEDIRRQLSVLESDEGT